MGPNAPKQPLSAAFLRFFALQLHSNPLQGRLNLSLLELRQVIIVGGDILIFVSTFVAKLSGLGTYQQPFRLDRSHGPDVVLRG